MPLNLVSRCNNVSYGDELVKKTKVFFCYIFTDFVILRFVFVLIL